MQKTGITLKIYATHHTIGITKKEIFTYGATIYLPEQSNDILIMNGENSPDSKSVYYIHQDKYVSSIEIYGTCSIIIGENALDSEKDFSVTVLVPIILDMNQNTVKRLFINACTDGAVIKNAIASDYAFTVGMDSKIENITARGKNINFKGISNGISTTACLHNLNYVVSTRGVI